MAVGVDDDPVQGRDLLAGQGVDLPDAFELVAEQGQTPGPVLQVRREDLDDVAAHAEGAAEEVGVVAPVLELDQALEHVGALDGGPGPEGHRHLRIGLDGADAVDAGHRRHDDHVVVFEQRPRRRVAHAVDLLVDGGVLLDVGVGPRHVGLGLVVVVIGNEILDRVVREERLHLAVELGRQGLVGGQHQGRALHPFDHVGHGEGLARPGDAEQHLVALATVQPVGQGGDGLGLVAGGDELGHQGERPAAFHGRALAGDEDGAAGEEFRHGPYICPMARGLPGTWRRGG